MRCVAGRGEAQRHRDAQHARKQRRRGAAQTHLVQHVFGVDGEHFNNSGAVGHENLVQQPGAVHGHKHPRIRQQSHLVLKRVDGVPTLPKYDPLRRDVVPLNEVQHLVHVAKVPGRFTGAVQQQDVGRRRPWLLWHLNVVRFPRVVAERQRRDLVRKHICSGQRGT